jgi:hypothetical protein
MNLPVPLDLGDFILCKRYGQLIGWSTLVDLDHDAVDLGHDVFDLSHDVFDLGHDVLDFGCDVLDKARRTWKKIKTNPETKYEVTW